MPGFSIVQRPDIKEYHSDPYLASNQEGRVLYNPQREVGYNIHML